MSDTKLGRGRPLRHGEKKGRREIAVTPTAWAGLEALAAKGDCSVSELVERLGRGLLSTSGELLGDEPQGDLLTVTEWAITTGKAVDTQGRRYRVMREKDS